MGRPRIAEFCCIDNCGQAYYSKGYCRKHYTAFAKYNDPLFVFVPPQFSSESFWSHVAITSDDNECWEWQGSMFSTTGYGRIGIDSRTYLAHRLAWELTHGRESRLWILHSCDNPPCCNPNHLREGTAKDNVDDMWLRGRVKVLKGAEHPRAKLNEADIQQIRQYLAQGLGYRRIAPMFHVTTATIQCIATNKTWRHLV